MAKPAAARSFKFELEGPVARWEPTRRGRRHLPPAVGRLTIFGPCPDESTWRALHRQLRSLWASPYPGLGELRDEGDRKLLELLAERGTPPRRGGKRGEVRAWWEELLSAARAAGITRERSVGDDDATARVFPWKDWRALRLFVVRRDRARKVRLSSEFTFGRSAAGPTLRASYLLTNPERGAGVEFPEVKGERRRGQRRRG